MISHLYRNIEAERELCFHVVFSIHFFSLSVIIVISEFVCFCRSFCWRIKRPYVYVHAKWKVWYVQQKVTRKYTPP